MLLRRALGNARALAISTAAGQALALLAGAYLARALGPDGVGTIGYLNALGNFFVFLGTLGLNYLGVREIAARAGSRERFEVTGTLVLLNLSGAAVATGAFLVVGQVLPAAPGLRAHIPDWALVVFASAFSLAWVAQGHQRMWALGGSSILRGILYLVLLLAAGALLDVGAAIRASALAAFAGSACLIAYLAWRARSRLHPVRVARLWSIARAVAPNVLTVTGSYLLVRVYYYSDQVILGVVAPAYELGLYVSAYKIIIMLETGIGVGLSAILPVLAGADATSRRHLTHRFLLIGAVCGGAASLALLTGAPLWLTVLWGDRFREADLYLRLLAGIVLWSSTQGVLAQYFLAERRDRVLLRASATAAALNVALNLLLIPRFGVTGAAVASIAAKTAESGVFFHAYFAGRGTRPPQFLGENAHA